MSSMRLAQIREAAPGTVLKDGEVRGLQLRAFANSKAFYFYYRTRSGTQRMPKLGNLPTVTLDQARREAVKGIASTILNQSS